MHVVDLDSERISSKAVVPESVNRDRDPNPRGGVRGARGLATTDGRLLMANAERVFVLDASWTPTDTFEHPHLAGVHDLLCHG